MVLWNNRVATILSIFLFAAPLLAAGKPSPGKGKIPTSGKKLPPVAVPQNLGEAARLCQFGDTFACFHLGLMEYQKGEHKNAYEIFARLCEQRVATACINSARSRTVLDRLEKESSSREAMPSETASQVTPASLSTPQPATPTPLPTPRVIITPPLQPMPAIDPCDDAANHEENNGACLETAVQSEDKEEYTEAEKRYLKACEKRGNAAACFNLATLLETRKQNDEALRFYQMACDKKNDAGCLGRGVLLYNMDRDDEAKTLLSKLCSGGNIRACRYYQQMTQP